MPKSSKRRNRLTGYCNICNTLGKLTWDHVPPKGSASPGAVEIRAFTQWLTEAAPGRVNFYGDLMILERLSRRRIAQDGVKFPTLCANCNNKKLGARYDRELKRVSHHVGGILRASSVYGWSLPAQIGIPIRTHFLMRGIVGHLLASQPSRDPRSPLPGSEDGFYKGLRDYFLDESLPLPKTIRVYTWLYPSTDHVIVKGLGLVASRSSGFVFGDLIKFFPMAYYIVDTTSQSADLPVPVIHGNGCNDIDCEILLYITPASVPPTNWPETPDPEHNTIMPAELAIRSQYRRPKLRP